MTLSTCGCCGGIGARTPADVANVPGLPAVAYRIGTYGSFRASLLAGLSHQAALAALRSRSTEDFTIALLDAFACVCDVLTFYSERIVNEAYLRTATELLSVDELVALIGYARRPGTAAKTYLAVTLENVPGAPVATTIYAGLKVQSLPAQDQPPATFETIEDIAVDPAFNLLRPRLYDDQPVQVGMPAIVLAGVDANVRRGDALLLVDGSGMPAFRFVAGAAVDRDAKLTTLALDATVHAPANDGISTADPGVYVFRTRASLFGAGAPQYGALPQNAALAKLGLPNPNPTDWGVPMWQMSDKAAFLDGVHGGVTAAGYLAFYDPGPDNSPDNNVTLMSLASATVVTFGMSDYAASAKVTAVLFDTIANVLALTGKVAAMPFLRSRTVYAQSERLALAQVPVAASVLSGNTIELDAQPGRPPIPLHRHVAVEGLPPGGGAKQGEVVLIAGVQPAGQGRTVLTLDGAGLRNVYDLASVTLNLNVAAATHGETKHETLGSGDATAKFRTFALQQPPLTYVPAPTASGNASTLAVRVNDLAWHEVDSLYGARPADRIFVTRLDDAGKTVVGFGDGSMGAIPPTGTQNVVATYRAGSGSAGNLGPNRLTLPLTRPLGMRSVTNPVAATGGVDPQSLADVRDNGPIGVKTLDRVVSLTDYQDFARTFSGIGKALATWTWDGARRSVFLTVAGAGGAALAAGGETLTDLLGALAAAGEPDVNLRVAAYRPASFRLGVSLAVDPDHDQGAVIAAVRAALVARFSFGAMTLGEAVSESEILAAVQRVDGVIASRLDVLERESSVWFYRYRLRRFGLRQAPPPHILFAAYPQPGERGTVLAAELLTVDPDIPIGTFA